MVADLDSVSALLLTLLPVPPLLLSRVTSLSVCQGDSLLSRLPVLVVPVLVVLALLHQHISTISNLLLSLAEQNV